MSSFHDVLAICIRQFVCFQATVCFLCSGVNPFRDQVPSGTDAYGTQLALHCYGDRLLSG